MPDLEEEEYPQPETKEAPTPHAPNAVTESGDIVPLPQPRPERIILPRAKPDFVFSGPGEINWQHISLNEGGQWLHGYVPKDGRDRKKTNPNSGVTVATGFDLGAHNLYDLEERLGLEQSLVEAFKPYLGLKGKKAEAVLEEAARQKQEERRQAGEKNPPLEPALVITQAQADKIDEAVNRETIHTIKEKYNEAIKAQGKGLEWDELPSEVKTITIDLAHQYGTKGIQDTTKSFWRALVAQDWPGIHKALLKFARIEYGTKVSRHSIPFRPLDGQVDKNFKAFG